MQLQKPFPVPNSTTSYWRAKPDILDNYRSTAELPRCSDIVIIGSGMTGVSAAYNILREAGQNPPSITILEARELCSGATGRNGGHLKIGVLRYPQIIARWGIEEAKEVANFHHRQINALKEVVERENIDCDFLLTRSFDVFMQQDESEKQSEKIAQLRDAGFECIPDIDVIPEAHVEAITGIKGARGARSVPGASLRPYHFVAGLMHRILDRVNLQTHTMVQSVADSHDGHGFYCIQTSRGVTRARRVIFATNGYSSALVPSMDKVIVPWKGTACSLKYQQPSSLQTRTYTYNITATSKTTHYLINRMDGAAILGGGIQELFSDRDDLWLNNYDDSTQIEEHIVRRYSEERMESFFQDWKDNGASIDRIWTGIMGYTPDGFSFIGELPEVKDQFLIGGFNGAGMVNIFLATEGIAKMIVHEIPYEETCIPRIYKLTKERLDKAKKIGVHG